MIYSPLISTYTSFIKGVLLKTVEIINQTNQKVPNLSIISLFPIAKLFSLVTLWVIIYIFSKYERKKKRNYGLQTILY